MRPALVFIGKILTVSAALFVFTQTAYSQNSNLDSVNFFYQRTMYLENLIQQGAWWANPCLLTEVNGTTAYTSNSGFIGRRYILSSFRVMVPLSEKLHGGIGVTGAGMDEGRTLQGTGSGASYSSTLSFNQPSLEGAASYALPLGFSAALLQAIGSEGIPLSYDPSRKTYFMIWGTGFGLMTPAFFDYVKLSFSTFSVRHFQRAAWWDNTAKAGLLFYAPDSLIRGCVEYAFSFNNPGALFTNTAGFSDYEVFRASLSLRIMKIAGLLVGYSVDTRLGYDNGRTFHAGIELRPSREYPYYGGYEAALATSRDIAVINRIWVGYDLRKK